jgi:hypothetical protein
MSIPIHPCQTIDEVIGQLDQIIANCIQTHNKLGYFACLYRNVTGQVRAAIAAGRFEDGPRMERLDVSFANRYFDALDRHWRGLTPTASWAIHFQAARQRHPIILQHLLLGMNAHINLDLAVSALQTAPGAELPGLKRDFLEVTVLLDELIDSVQERIDQVSPWFGILDRVGRTDEALCAFAIGEARRLAWEAAERLNSLPPEQLAREIAAHDAAVAALGRQIHSPGLPLALGLRLVRVRERHPVAAVIRVLRMDAAYN